MTKDNMFSDKAFLKRLFNLTLPLSFQVLMLALVAACDAVMLGRVEQNSMAAVSLATQIQFIQNMMLCAVTGSISILGAQYWGKGDVKTIHKIFGMSIRIAVVISAIFAVACVCFSTYLMHIFANDNDLITIGAGYLRIAGWSYLLTGLSQCYLGMMRVTDHADRCAIISSGAVIINLILNGIFIFGFMGIPTMGANGAAYATLIARIIELSWAVISSYQKGFIHPEFKDLLVHDALLAKDYVRCGLPLAGAAMFWGVGFTSYTAIMGHLGADAAAANSVAAVVRDLMCCLCDGISAASGIVIGNELGAGNLETGKLYGRRIAKIAVFIGFLTTALVLLVTPFVVNYMILTDKAKNYLVGMMVIMAIYMIGRCINTVVINGVFASGGDTLFDIYSLAVCMWCLAVPLALFGAFVFHWPVLMVYACTCVDEVGKLPWVFHHYRKYKWVKDLTR
ncbi:putative efflux protein, MATE family [Pseudobutyrivibrio sp. YE44]|uniref:MATE family efflux transporter n=1 Tax=Pseudobutyrivibrio sp. YE44 TaxID=1520802 RepID=UPI00088DCBC2|nr:MATE family efflux transporter [Pseudobutyrivibrio sp. YE44]SDB04655.1 putative efflux protein, MATE family [Pseudobutyrivibrio sp. YE44]